MLYICFHNNKFKKWYFAVVVVLLLVGFTVLYQNHVNKQIAAYRETLTQYEERFNQYSYKHFKNDYTILIDTYNLGLNNKDISLLKECCEKLDVLEASVIEANTLKYEKKIEKLINADVSQAYENELVQLNKLESEVQTLLANHQFKDASALIKKWSKLIKDMSFVADNLSIYVNQVDTSSYPLVSLYLSIHDIRTNQTPHDLDYSHCFLKETHVEDQQEITSYKDTVSYMKQLNQNLPVSITIAADMGNSKTEKELNEMMASLSAFLEQVQFHVHDQVEILSITDTVIITQEFSSDKDVLLHSLSKLTPSNEASQFYDGLTEAIIHAATQSGARCVIAFTDGEDNLSSYDWDYVVSLANQYSVPVFVIGVGNDVSHYVLERIGTQTNGSFRNIKNFSSLNKAFSSVYEDMKNLYFVQYKSGITEKIDKERFLNISYEHRLYGGTCDYSFPSLTKAGN